MEKNFLRIENGVLVECADKNVECVVIPDGVTEIGAYAFEDCYSLEAVIIPNGVTEIGMGAFKGCKSLTEITIPDSAIKINGYAFDETQWLEERRNENPLVIVNNILIDGTTCEGDVVIPDGIIALVDSAMRDSILTSVTIPDSVVSIGCDAFEYCESLVSVIIPNSVSYIGELAFEECQELKEIVFNGTEDEWNKIEGTDEVYVSVKFA